MYSNDNVEYAQGRLVGTLISYNNKVVNVHNISFAGYDSPLQVSAKEIISRKWVADSIDNFDMTPIKLGFVHYAHLGLVSYVQRIPIRNDWRQGTRQNNVRTVWGAEFWDEKCIARTAQNMFNTLEKIREKAVGLVPWSRDFAVNPDGEIYYKWYGKIGNFPSNDNNNYLLDRNFFWVEEALREAVG